MKKPARLYEVSFFSVLWMVFPESWKRSCPNFYAHDCSKHFKGLTKTPLWTKSILEGVFSLFVMLHITVDRVPLVNWT